MENLTKEELTRINAGWEEYFFAAGYVAGQLFDHAVSFKDSVGEGITIAWEEYKGTK